jgi:hypothetical protein
MAATDRGTRPLRLKATDGARTALATWLRWKLQSATRSVPARSDLAGSSRPRRSGHRCSARAKLPRPPRRQYPTGVGLAIRQLRGTLALAAAPGAERAARRARAACAESASVSALVFQKLDRSRSMLVQATDVMASDASSRMTSTGGRSERSTRASLPAPARASTAPKRAPGWHVLQYAYASPLPLRGCVYAPQPRQTPT